CGVLAAEVEDVADLDRRLEAQRAAAVGTGVPLARLAQVGEPRLVVAASLDAAQVKSVSVRAGDVLALTQRLVGDDLAPPADPTDRPAARTEGLADLLVGCRAPAGRDARQDLPP